MYDKASEINDKSAVCSSLPFANRGHPWPVDAPKKGTAMRKVFLCHLGLYSLSGKTSYRQISWSLEAARLDVAMVVSLWNLTGTSAAVLRSCGKTSYGLVNRGPGRVATVPLRFVYVTRVRSVERFCKSWRLHVILNLCVSVFPAGHVRLIIQQLSETVLDQLPFL